MAYVVGAIVAEDTTEMPFFLTGDSSMAQTIQSFDWSITPIGLPASWSRTLQSMVQLLLASKQPMFLVWGDERS
jgi:hypothetical protein